MHFFRFASRATHYSGPRSIRLRSGSHLSAARDELKHDAGSRDLPSSELRCAADGGLRGAGSASEFEPEFEPDPRSRGSGLRLRCWPALGTVPHPA